MTDIEWEQLSRRLASSPFRSRFHLGEKERKYFLDKGEEIIRRHAHDFISSRLAPAFIANDGKQTPMRGHPVFIAQHATATCCRSCLEKWHHIEKGRQLTDEEIDYVLEVIMRYFEKEMNI